MFATLAEHRQYLADEIRLNAYRKAVASVVRRGAAVLDLGAGTGIMGMLACRAGAARVYVADSTEMLEIARNSYHANGFAERAVFLNEHSLQVRLPEQVDVVIADQMSSFGIGAGLLECFRDARKRLLKPEGVLLPQALELFLAPAQGAELWEAVDFWSQPRAGFAFAHVRVRAANLMQVGRLPVEEMLGPAQSLITFTLGEAGGEAFASECELKIGRAGLLRGLAGWFRAELAPGIDVTNSPLAEQRINRQHAFFPLDKPVPVVAGDTMRVRFRATPAESLFTWRVEINGGKGGAFSHSTFHSLLLTPDDLRRTNPNFAPQLSPQGRACQTILNLCRQQRQLRDIEKQVYEQYAELFATPAEAAKFVAETLKRYAV
jgi:protein arginine N-methyltransferase 1